MRKKFLRYGEEKMKKITVSDIVKCAAGAACVCVLSPVAVYTGALPVSLATFAVCLTAGVLGKFKGTLSVFVYTALGCVGFPVFSFFTGGFQRLFSTTGGFIVGYLPCAFVTGLIIDFAKDRFFVYPLGMAAGVILCYAVGTLWYSFYTSSGFIPSLSVCVVPFILFDVIKIAVASFVAYNTRKITDRL